MSLCCVPLHVTACLHVHVHCITPSASGPLASLPLLEHLCGPVLLLLGSRSSRQSSSLPRFLWSRWSRWARAATSTLAALVVLVVPPLVVLVALVALTPAVLVALGSRWPRS